MKSIPGSRNRWLVAIVVVIGVVFGNDFLVTMVRPFIDAASAIMPAN